MFALLISLLVLILPQSNSDTLKVATEIDGVTVFQNQAQIHRSKEVQLQAGTNTLVFEGLSDFVNTESIQLKGDGRYTLLSLTTRNNFTEQQNWRADVQKLRDEIDLLNTDLIAKKSEAEVVESEIGMLNSTQEIIKNNKLSSTELSELLTMYRTNLGKLLTQKNSLNREIQELSERIGALTRQIRESGQIERTRFLEVVAEIKSDIAQSLEFDLSYLVYNAGWTPSYDIRTADITSPMEITYKANIYQNTGIDWKEVKFVINSGDPSSSAIKPELNPFWLGYYVHRPTLPVDRDGVDDIQMDVPQTLTGKLAGVQIQENKTMSGYSGAAPSVRIRGVSSVNSEPALYAIDGEIMSEKEAQNLLKELGEDQIESTEILKGNEATALYGSKAENGVISITTKRIALVSSEMTSNQTSFSYEIGIPYSVPSDGKEHTVEIKEESIKADYNFSTVPKLSNYAYLVGNIPDWSSLNLIDGNANIYFDNSFVGTTLLSPEAFEDTLAISLGKDERIVIERKKRNEFSKKNFLRNKVRELYSYEINIRNTKSEAITIHVEDQIPLSTNEQIKVTVKNLSGGKQDEETGLLEWDIPLEPGSTKTLILEFEIEYPKGRRINY